MKPANSYGFQERDFAEHRLESAHFCSFKTAVTSWFHVGKAAGSHSIIRGGAGHLFGLEDHFLRAHQLILHLLDDQLQVARVRDEVQVIGGDGFMRMFRWQAMRDGVFPAPCGRSGRRSLE
jgi:hypothetical protein